MGLRHMHPVRDPAHDDRRHWRQRNRRLAELLGEQAAELVVLRSALEHARDRRATA